MCHAATKNFAGLMTARFFLGVGEAAIAPGFSLITGMFYQREEQPLRYAPLPPSVMNLTRVAKPHGTLVTVLLRYWED